MKHYTLSPHPGPQARRTGQRTRPAPIPWPWRRAALAAGAALTLLWALWPEPSPQPPLPASQPPIAQAQRVGQAWPFAAGAAPLASGTPRAAASASSPWERLQSTAQPETLENQADTLDPREHNRLIAPARLSVQHPQAAQAFLDHVALQSEPRGGYVVQAVLPGSRYAHAGLQPGDTIYTLDLPDQAALDESNMVALTSVHTLAFEVVRAGAIVRLSVPLNQDPPGDAPS